MTLSLVLIVAICLVLLGVVLLLVVESRRRRLGSLSQRAIYEDTAQQPGTILSARSLPLVGKPDYLLKRGGEIIPVELKTGTTPRSPYTNHRAQVHAYCLLVAETYNVRPSHGVIKYPDGECIIPYTKEDEQQIRAVVAEIVRYKTGGRNLSPEHETTQLCRECRVELATLST